MPKRTQLSDAEREQRRAADRAFVQQAVDALRSSEAWQRSLTTRSHFHTYSLIWGGRCQRCGGGSLCASATYRQRGGAACGGAPALRLHNERPYRGSGAISDHERDLRD
jgi:hypothetical protein